MTAYSVKNRSSRVWTGFLRHDWDGRLTVVRPEAEQWVVNGYGSRIARIDHFLLGKVAGRIEYAVIDGTDSPVLTAAHYPVPWELLRHEETLGGFVMSDAEERLINAPSYPIDQEPDLSYMRCVCLHNHYGLFF